MKNSFLVLALVACLASSVIAETSFVFDNEPSFEFWEGGAADRPKKNKDRAYQVWKSLKVCEPGVACIKVRFDQLTWTVDGPFDLNEDPVGPFKAIQWTAAIPGFSDFYVGATIPESCEGFPDSGLACVGIFFSFSHSYPAGTNFTFNLRKSRNQDVTFHAPPLVSNLSPITDLSSGTRVSFQWTASPDAGGFEYMGYPNSDPDFVASFVKVGSGFSATGAAVAGAVGGVVILGALGFWAYGKKKNQDGENWESVEMELP